MSDRVLIVSIALAIFCGVWISAEAYIRWRLRREKFVPYSRANEMKPGAFSVGRDVRGLL